VLYKQKANRITHALLCFLVRVVGCGLWVAGRAEGTGREAVTLLNDMYGTHLKGADDTCIYSGNLQGRPQS
jgi:hypothetical protein